MNTRDFFAGIILFMLAKAWVPIAEELSYATTLACHLISNRELVYAVRYAGLNTEGRIPCHRTGAQTHKD